jgi:hypothetical protein
MKVERIDIDSQVVGGTVLAIHDFDANGDLHVFERAYVTEHHPFYVTCKVPLEQIAAIHALENAGFNLVECQIKSSVKLRRPQDVSAFDYEFLEVTHKEDLRAVLDIAGSTFVHDRFCMDPALGKPISAERYRKYVLKSFHAPNEAVYRLIDRSTGRVVAFKTHKYVSSTEVLFLLGGVHADLKNVGVGLISEYFEFNELIRKGIKTGITHVSAANYPIVNLEIGKMGFRVVTTFAILRKTYSASATP